MNEEQETIQNNNQTSDTDNNNIDNGNDSNNDDFDVVAMVDMLKEKEEQIESLQKDIAELKKSNANLIVKVNAGTKEPEKSFEENLFGLVGCPTRKE